MQGGESMSVWVRQGRSQRQLSSAVGGQTASYSYEAAGQLMKVTLSGSCWMSYDYAQRRLSRSIDALGRVQQTTGRE